MAQKKAQPSRGTTKAKSSTGRAKRKQPVARAVPPARKVLGRGKPARTTRDEADAAAETTKQPKAATPRARPLKRTTDISMDRLAKAYTPKQTNGKASFRADGNDKQRDQDRGIDDERWNDEDRLTNKSGDPRIGTHGRSYEPGEPAPVDPVSS